ncbi:dihydrolipoamide acetyltransferase family protein [Mucilaginibacter sp. P25]|uniref:Dihydrolipoamide acetyltransferase component of pyruvate dehydrogenase complex n=1 Tax=Mucilaginibacter gossypii TaxID=551996 RepID=A0A1G7P9E8_9SPHI|nr:dihydrolipoamide acetyltransferase family protein [Mucilaginibacter gossypii]SDF82908.1 2-oxoglutarate dehydrogenase E2 component (dihydrolipoamide succinyltransferase) [Mucilaginibacter gossypii]
MAKYQLLLPKMGESVAEATVIKWIKKPGDKVNADDAVMEIATDKVDSDVPSPVAGKLVEQLYQENDVVQVGAVIAIIETEEAETAQISVQPEETPVPQSAEEPQITETTYQEAVQLNEAEKVPEAGINEIQSSDLSGIPGIDQLEQKSSPAASVFKSEGRFYSPLVRNIATQEGITIGELDSIPGTGSDGRLTKDDLLNYLQAKTPSVQNTHQLAHVESFTTQTAGQPVKTVEPAKEARPAAEPAPQPIITAAPGPAKTETPKAAPVEQQPAPAVSVTGSDEIIEMDRMRRLIADHMVMSKQTSPHVTSFVEADVTNLVLWREKVKNSFEKREGEKITFTPIFIEAVAKAIKDFPMINVSVNGTQIIKKAAINISMATALPNGNLIVPVIKKADELNLVGLTKAVNDLANRARNGKLLPDDVKEGTFTITNVGSFGNVMGTPIINQPQVAILAVGAIKKKPAVIETKEGDMIAIRHMMFLSLSYDHRVVDGALGGSFVRRVADYLEKWDSNREV